MTEQIVSVEAQQKIDETQEFLVAYDNYAIASPDSLLLLLPAYHCSLDGTLGLD